MISVALNFLHALGGVQVLDLFFVAILLDIPRYFLGFVAVTCSSGWSHLRGGLSSGHEGFVLAERVSILLAGFNEEQTIERCVRSLREQSYCGDLEIVCVDDGSTDNSFAIMRRLERSGIIQRAMRLDLRGGKSAANNLCATLATGDIFIVVDADCSFDRDAIREILRPFLDEPGVAAVCGNILVRNWQDSLVAALQQVEYLITISLGKTLADAFGFVTCISGAFGAFKRDAWRDVGGVDVGAGEDFDLTFRLRLAGHSLRFARHAICYTDAPDTFRGFFNQRGRWERDTFWIRFRKFGYTFNPMHQRFRWSEMFNQLEFIIFTLLPALIFPIYLLYLFIMLPGFAPVLILAVSIGLAAIDVVAFLFALLIMGRGEYFPLIILAPIFGLFHAYVVRSMRLLSYIDEMIFSRSLDDNYVPKKVRELSIWR